jgi:hypothetical protein
MARKRNDILSIKNRKKIHKKERLKKGDTCVYVAFFDLKAVVTTPCLLVSELFYSRKLKLYCYTILQYIPSETKMLYVMYKIKPSAKRGM